MIKCLRPYSKRKYTIENGRADILQLAVESFLLLYISIVIDIDTLPFDKSVSILILAASFLAL